MPGAGVSDLSFVCQSLSTKVFLSLLNLVEPGFTKLDLIFSFKLYLGEYAPGSGVVVKVRPNRSDDTGNALRG